MIHIEWRQRTAPLSVYAIVLQRATVADVLRRIKEERNLTHIRGVIADDYLVLHEPNELIPWIEGSIYVGRSIEDNRLMMPCYDEPHVPEKVVFEALSTYADASIVLVIPDEKIVIDCSKPMYYEIESLLKIYG